MIIQIVREPIARDALRSIAQGQFGDFVKAVVDVRLGVMAIGGKLHADEQVDRVGTNRIEFGSMINVRPSQGNRSRSVEDPTLRQQIVDVVTSFIGA